MDVGRAMPQGGGETRSTTSWGRSCSGGRGEARGAALDGGRWGSGEALPFSLSLAALEGEIEQGERERSRGLGLDRGAVGLRWAAGMGRLGVGRPSWALFSLSL